MVNEILNSLKEQNLYGVVALSVFGGLVYLLKGLPLHIWRFIKWRFSVSVSFFNEDENFYKVSEWLASLKYASNTRNIRFESFWNRHACDYVENVSLGTGVHLFWFEKVPVFINRKTTGESVSAMRKEEIVITTLGTSRKTIDKIINNIKDDSGNSKYVKIYTYDGQWRLMSMVHKRSMESVVIPLCDKGFVLSNFERFIKDRDWYIEHGIIYKFGALFYGPPGTGKTSLAIALASKFQFSIYYLSLGSIKNDNDLIESVRRIPKNSMILLEDVDSFQLKRGFQNSKEVETHISLSAVLNVLDGVVTKDGQIMIATTNNIDSIDRALLRPGRIDLCVSVDVLNLDGAIELCSLFMDKKDAEDFVKNITLPTSAANLQSLILERRR